MFQKYVNEPQSSLMTSSQLEVKIYFIHSEHNIKMVLKWEDKLNI